MTPRDGSRIPPGVRRLPALPASPARLGRELDDEVRFHLEMRIAELVRAGMNEEAARAEALRRFGDTEELKAYCQSIEVPHMHRLTIREWIDGGAVPHLRVAVRRLFRAPAFAGSAALTLTLGIAATSAVFTVVNGVLLRPLPYRDAGRLVDLSHTLEISGLARVDQSDATYLLYRRDNHVFSDVGAYRAMAVNLSMRSGPGDGTPPERVAAARVTPSVFHVLGVTARVGRGLGDDDARIFGPPVVVLGDGYWRRALGGDSSIIGRRVSVDGVDCQVVGIMPPGFDFPAAGTALWLPLAFDPGRTRSAAFDFRGIARLEDGSTIAAARTDLQQLLPRVPEVFPGRLTAGAIAATRMQAVVRPLRDVIVGNVARTLWIVLGAVGVLLLLACANVANLFLARAEGRHRELAVRRALGAGRGALLAEFLSEALVLAAAGAASGILVAWAGVHALQATAWGARIPRLAEVHVGGVVLAVTASLAGVVALAVAAVPVLRAARMEPATALLASAPSTSGGRTRSPMRRGLVIAQVALALVLLSAAGLFARSFARLRAVDPGFAAAHVLTFRVALSKVMYPSSGDAARLVVNALDAIDALPGVQASGVVTKLPLDEEGRRDSAVFVEDRPSLGGMPNIHPMFFVTPGYFRAMGIPLVAGRLFARPEPGADTSRIAREVIVSQAFANRYWTDGSAVGRRIRMNPRDPWSTVIGVVGSVHDSGLDEPPGESVYSPIVTITASGMPWTPGDVAFAVRAWGEGDEAALAAPIERAIAQLAPSLPLYRVRPADDLLSQAVARTTFTLFLLGIAAVAAMVIGTMGIYGVIAYLVSLRTREMGVRLALGARPADVRRMVTRHALADTAIGIVVGLAGAVAATRVLVTLLYGVRPADPVALGGSAGLLVLAALAASWVPARRAARVEPATALRVE